jgi:methionyl-tRNA formyltransferase
LIDGHEVVAVWTQPDRPAGRGHKLVFSPVKEFALSQGLSVFQPERIKTEEAKSLFASHDADVAVVVAYGRILPEGFLRAPHRGCVNVHFSLLPLYRGAAPVNWAIINGEKETGVTTMFMEPTLDTGPILLQSKTAIGAKETAPELMERLAEIGAGLLGETLARLDELAPRQQDDTAATFAPMLKKEDGLIDWSQNATAIERRIRGLQPWPNAYTYLHSKRLTIWHAEPVQMPPRHPTIGQVVHAFDDYLVVGCGENTLLALLEIQPEGRKRMSARDVRNGMHIRHRDRFG